jgi:hypothetical protein
MTILDLLFILCVLGSAGSLVRVAYLAVRGRARAALRAAGRWAAFAACYLAVLVAVSLTQSQRIVAIGREQCFDDWCLTVDSVRYHDSIGSAAAKGTWAVVTAHVSSHMRGRRQSEPDAYGYLLDASGHRIEQSERGQAALVGGGMAGTPMGSFVEPNGSFTSRMAFDVPRDTGALVFVKERRARFPGIIIIGDPVSLFHRRTVVPLGHPAIAVPSARR